MGSDNKDIQRAKASIGSLLSDGMQIVALDTSTIKSQRMASRRGNYNFNLRSRS